MTKSRLSTNRLSRTTRRLRNWHRTNKQLWGNYLLNIYWKLNRGEYEALEKELGY